MELAVLLPLLVFLFVVAADFARVYYYSLTLKNCARAGALYASESAIARESPYANTAEAALADATNISPSPTITSVQGADASGRPYVAVTATYTFQTISGFPGIPSSFQLQRTVKMPLGSAVPNP